MMTLSLNGSIQLLFSVQSLNKWCFIFLSNSSYRRQKNNQHLPTDLCKKAYLFQWLMSTVLKTNKLHSSEMLEITIHSARARFRWSIHLLLHPSLKLLAAPSQTIFFFLEFFQRKHQSNAIDLRPAARYRELILTSYEKFIKANPQFVLAGMSKTSDWYKQVVSPNGFSSLALATKRNKCKIKCINR